MGISGTENIDRAADKVQQFFSGFAEDLKEAGEAGAEAIVRTTLAGIGENDEPFAPYSPAYAALLDAAGGKRRDVVDLRGIFFNDGAASPLPGRALTRREGAARLAKAAAAGGGRRFRFGVGFAFKRDKNSLGLARFTATSKTTRPQLGITDPYSENSLDLIKVEATDTTLTLTYEPRNSPHMIYHQQPPPGSRLPQRKWFSANKRAVWAGMTKVLSTLLAARAERFNSGSGT